VFYFSRGEKVALVLLLAALVAAAGSMWWMGSRATTPTEPFFIDAPATAAGGEKVTVHVCGEVAKPGLYAVAGGTRVHQVLELAGGATQNADLSAVNLAAEVQDGQQINVPPKASAAAAPAPVAGPPSPASATLPHQSSAPNPPFTGKLNINRASAAQFDLLPGIGPAYAQKIVEYRNRLKAETGQGFTRVEQLMEIPGIGPKRFADIKDHVTL
jgi:competence protein ComEA